MDQAPQFIVEHQGRLYATISVAEYDPGAKELTDAQRRGVATIRKMFDEGKDQSRGVVWLRERVDLTSIQSTNPGPAPPQPFWKKILRWFR